MGAYIKGKYVTEENDPQHRIDVQSFLDESNFSGEFPGVTLESESVTFSGSHNEGTYHCVFNVPDDVDRYKDMVMDIDDDIEGIPILIVKTGPWGQTQILDWRLVGMLNDQDYYESDRGKWLVTGIATQALSAASGYLAYSNYTAGSTWTSAAVLAPGTLCVISQGAGVVSFYMIILDPGGNVPNFDKWQGYCDYINRFDGGINSMFDKYEEYKKKYNL